jgi:hypothetical protein
LVSDGLNRNTFWNLGAHPLILWNRKCPVLPV